jgi:tetratricopeptide (TPR) repeat protein
MFFTRLRTRAKWVFVVLVAVFAIGFLAFGVGAGGTGVGDAIRDFFGGDSGTVSQSDLEKKVAENPTDAEAVTQLSSLLLSQQRYVEATTVLEDYLEAKPNDATALQQLAATYDTRANQALQQANALRSAAFTGSFAASAFSFPTSNGFFGALGQDPVDEAQSANLQAEALDLGKQSDTLYTKEVDVYERLTKLKPDDATLYAQLGAVANQASETDKAIAAYEKYLELEPDGALAQQVEEQLNQLKALERTDTAGVEQVG